MKKITLQFLLFTLYLTLNSGLFAQANKEVNEEVPLKPLFELFTSSTCSPCAYANPIFDALLLENPGTHSVIKYQVNFPGSGDPYYTAEIGVRTSYYGVASVPSLYVNSDQMHPNECTQEVYDSYQSNTTSIDIDIVNAEIDLSNLLTVEVDINALADYSAGLKAHVAVVEKTTVENIGNNGEVEFHFVMMKMLPDAAGITLPALSNGDTETLEFSFDMSTTNMEDANDLELIVFVQDDADKSILQSEQGSILSELDDYMITFNIMDNNMTPVEGAEMFLENYGSKFSDANGIITYDGVLPGAYNYNIIAAGLLSTDGAVEVLAQDVVIEIVMEIPGYYYYEDFTGEDIPENYTTLNEGAGNFLYPYEGRIVFFRQSGDNQTIMLVAEQIDIIPGEKIFFDIGEDAGFPVEVVFGIISDPNDSETFVEVMTITSTDEWDTYEFLLEDLPTDETDIYFAWKHNTVDNSYFSLDNVIINYKNGTETYEVAFNAIDQNSNPIENVEVNLESYGILTSDNLGFINYQDVLPGTYTYTATKDGYESANGSVTVNEDDVFELVQMTSLISYYTINFTILDGSSPLEGAVISIAGLEQTTGANGETMFSEMEDGTYDYSISLNGYEAYDGQVVVNGEDVEVEVNLVIDGIENMNNQNLELFPNPSSDFMNIKFEEKIQSIDLYNMTGELLNSRVVDSKECKLDVSKYKKGIYLLMINTKEIIITRKVIIE